MVFLLTTNGAQAKEKADATVRLSAGSVAAGIGFSWGSGTLHYKGKNYHFTIDGALCGGRRRHQG